MTREEMREHNRRQLPELAAFVDDCRRVFGDGVRVLLLEIEHEKTTQNAPASEGAVLVTLHHFPKYGKNTPISTNNRAE